MALASFKLLWKAMQGWFDSFDVMRVLDAIIPMNYCDAFGPADLFLYEILFLDPEF